MTVTSLMVIALGTALFLLCYGSWTLGTFHGYEKGMDELVEILETLEANRIGRETRGND